MGSRYRIRCLQLIIQRGSVSRFIVAALDNGQSVNIIDHADDEQLRPWVYVSDPETDKPISATSTCDPNHGLLLGDSNPQLAPCTIVDFVKPNENRDEITVTLPGSTVPVNALSALNEWVRVAICTPNGPLTDAQIKGGISQGFSPPSLLGIFAFPAYYHNGACETLACVLADKNHRTAGNKTDVLADPQKQAQVVTFLESLDAATAPIK